MDYRFRNPTQDTFQLVVWTTEEYLCGELRAERRPEWTYHIRSEGEGFLQEADGVYRVGRVYRDTIDSKTGDRVARELIQENRARVLYDVKEIDPAKFITQGEKNKG